METEDEPFRVGAFLDMLNESFSGMRVSLRGEVSGVEERRGVTYFSLKDEKEESLLSCLVFRNDFLLHGVRLEDGQDIVVEGTPNVWKPRGRLSFRVSVIRLAGMGALKKAYDELRNKLEREGLFLEEKKRSIPDFSRRIALITSKEGAALGDFAANIGQKGFKITLFDAHVEGKRAIADLVQGVRYFNTCPEKWDVIVLIRGGGSLESLEAFNSETLVREIAASKIPIVAGIGHEKDVSLSALVADMMVSTPTAAARALGASWDEAFERVSVFERNIFEHFQNALFDSEKRLRFHEDFLRATISSFSVRFRMMEEWALRSIATFSWWKESVRKKQGDLWDGVCFRYGLSREMTCKNIERLAVLIRGKSPQALFARGYSVLRKNGRVIRSVSDIAKQDEIEVILTDGKILAKVEGRMMT